MSVLISQFISCWPNFSIVMSQRTGRPKQRDRDEGATTGSGAVRTQIFVVTLPSYEHSSWYPQMTTTVASKITDQRTP